MTFEQLKALREKATQGPWYFSTEPARVGDKLISGTQRVSLMGDCCLEDQGSPQNIEFIAALVNWFDLPSTQAMLEKGESNQRDAERLDYLERDIAEEGPLVLHNSGGTNGMRGLGLANTNRTLRKAIDDMRHANDAALKDQDHE